jgi:hypothetical protein
MATGHWQHHHTIYLESDGVRGFDSTLKFSHTQPVKVARFLHPFSSFALLPPPKNLFLPVFLSSLSSLQPSLLPNLNLLLFSPSPFRQSPLHLRLPVFLPRLLSITLHFAFLFSALPLNHTTSPHTTSIATPNLTSSTTNNVF